jgi:hypothetical protein
MYGQAVHGAEQVLTIECVGDDRVRAEFAHAIGTGRVANQPNDTVPSGDKKTGQRYSESSGSAGNENFHDVLRPASRTIA